VQLFAPRRQLVPEGSPETFGWPCDSRNPHFARIREAGVTMTNGVHALFYARDADKVRAFFKDVLKLGSVDAGHGWLIFALPPAQLGIHPPRTNRTTSFI
jgi:hypothetical protein